MDALGSRGRTDALLTQPGCSPDAHVILLQSADQLGCLAAVLLDWPHHAGCLGVQVQARLRAPHLKGEVGHLYVGRQHTLSPLHHSQPSQHRAVLLYVSKRHLVHPSQQSGQLG